jgi:hypothetical protein
MGENGRHSAMVIGRLEATLGRGWLLKKRCNKPHASKNMETEKQSAEMIRGENLGALGNYPNP